MLGVDDAVFVHQGKPVHTVELLDPVQELPQGRLGLQVGAVQDAHGPVHVVEVGFQLLRHHQGPPPGQLVQVEFTDPGYRLVGAGLGAGGHPDRGDQQDGGDNQPAPDGGGHGLPLLFFFDAPLL